MYQICVIKISKYANVAINGLCQLGAAIANSMLVCWRRWYNTMVMEVETTLQFISFKASVHWTLWNKSSINFYSRNGYWHNSSIHFHSKQLFRVFSSGRDLIFKVLVRENVCYSLGVLPIRMTGVSGPIFASSNFSPDTLAQGNARKHPGGKRVT